MTLMEERVRYKIPPRDTWDDPFCEGDLVDPSDTKALKVLNSFAIAVENLETAVRKGATVPKEGRHLVL